MRYSSDLRKKVVEAYNSKENTKFKIAEIFKISRTTLDSWLALLKTGGLYEAKKRTNIHKVKLNIDELKTHLELNPDMYQHETAKIFKVAPSTVWYNMKKLGISRKKNKRTLENEVKN